MTTVAMDMIEDTDSEDELPAGWEERVTTDGRVYYANHSSKSTQWHHPVTGKKKQVAGELPYGWEMQVNNEGQVLYIDHINKKTTFTDPRLAFAVDAESKTRGKSGRKEIKQKYDASTTAQQILQGRDLTGKYAVITGANSGIGFETARALALHGAFVVLACRDMTRANMAVEAIKKERPQAEVVASHLDLLSLRCVKQFAENYKDRKWPLHILILNAGVFGLPFTQTEDGFETTFQVNYLAQFYLLQLFKDILIDSSPTRVVIISAESHRFSDLTLANISEDKLSPPAVQYSSLHAYNQSKLCGLLMCQEVHRRMAAVGIWCNAVHPGNMICTGISRNWWLYRILFSLARPFTKSKEQGASTTVYCAAARELEGVGGFYFNHCFQCVPSDVATNRELSNALWTLSDRMVNKCLMQR